MPRNGEEAVRWYRKVALKGLAQAQYNMGVRHAQGKGAPMDFIAGYAWLKLAAAQSLESAIGIPGNTGRAHDPQGTGGRRRS